jgi:hypothetical protein
MTSHYLEIVISLVPKTIIFYVKHKFEHFSLKSYNFSILFNIFDIRKNGIRKKKMNFERTLFDQTTSSRNRSRSFDRITFFRNSKFSFEFHSFEIFLFFSFFRIRVLSKKKIISKDNRTKNNLYK